MTVTISYTTILFIIITICTIYVSANMNWGSGISVLINGAVIIMGAVCEERSIFGSNLSLKMVLITVAVMALFFSSLYAYYFHQMKQVERAIKQFIIEANIKQEEKFVKSVIEDFNKGKYYYVEIDSKRMYLKVDKEDGLWKLTYRNYTTKEELCYSESKDGKEET